VGLDARSQTTSTHNLNQAAGLRKLVVVLGSDAQDDLRAAHSKAGDTAMILPGSRAAATWNPREDCFLADSGQFMSA
jgi:hypothetical protein